MNNIIIQTKNLSKIYGKEGNAEVVALDNVSLEIRKSSAV